MAALENGHTLRKSKEPHFELCFGGLKQFCKTNYTDLGKRFRNAEETLSNGLRFKGQPIHRGPVAGHSSLGVIL